VDRSVILWLKLKNHLSRPFAPLTQAAKAQRKPKKQGVAPLGVFAA
jgi:hypothetical protein